MGSLPGDLCSKPMEMIQDRDSRDQIRNGITSSPESETLRRVTTAYDPFHWLHQELLPSIPNEVTLYHIASLLPRGTCEVLTNVSQDWKLAVQSHMVYDARVSKEATKKYFLVQCRISTCYDEYYIDYRKPGRFRKYILSLYSRSEERWYNLPTIPDFRTGMPDSCEIVFLNGSMYVLGGTTNPRKGNPIAHVYVLDLAGHQLEWRRCSNMQVPRIHFTAAVMDERIFVFGGARQGMDFPGGEVYDPRVDAWSWIKCTVPLYPIYEVFSVGKKLVLCGEPVTDDEAAGLLEDDADNDDDEPLSDDEALGLLADDVANDQKIEDLPIGETLVDTKFQVKIHFTGFPKLIRTSDHDAKDELDGVHKLIENHEHFQENTNFWNNDFNNDPLVEEDIACYFKRKVEHHEQQRDFVGAYDPVKDEWKGVERESMDIARVDIVRWPTPYYYLDLGDYAGFKMWSTSL